MLNMLKNNTRRYPVKKEEGFTLIELMIVVVIIGILAAIAIPIFANQQEAAAFASTKSDVKSVSTMAVVHKTKTGKYPRTCDEWKTVIPVDWKSASTGAIGVRTSSDGMNLWVESQPNTIVGMAAEKKEANTAIYDSARTGGVMSMEAFVVKYSIPSGTRPVIASGYTVTGFHVVNIGTCWPW